MLGCKPKLKSEMELPIAAALFVVIGFLVQLRAAMSAPMRLRLDDGTVISFTSETTADEILAQVAR